MKVILLGQNLLNKETLDSMKDFELNIAKRSMQENILSLSIVFPKML